MLFCSDFSLMCAALLLAELVVIGFLAGYMQLQAENILNRDVFPRVTIHLPAVRFLIGFFSLKRAQKLFCHSCYLQPAL